MPSTRALDPLQRRTSRALIILAVVGAPLKAFADEPTSSPASAEASSARPRAAEGEASVARARARRQPHALVGPVVAPAEQPASAAPPPTRDVPRHWYGWQTLLTAGSSLALMWGTLLFTPDVTLAVPAVGFAGYVLGGPIVHWAHHNTGKGFGSLGLNLGLPLALGALSLGGSKGSFTKTVFGVALGTVIAVALDVAVLAYEPVAAEERVAAHRTRTTEPALSLVPEVVITSDRAALVGLRGAF